jgi:hypothetical protein
MIGCRSSTWARNISVQQRRSIFRRLHGAGAIAREAPRYGTWSVTDAGRRVRRYGEAFLDAIRQRAENL